MDPIGQRLIPINSIPTNNLFGIVAKPLQGEASPDLSRPVVRDTLSYHFTYSERKVVFPSDFKRGYVPEPKALIGTLIDLMI
jgi:hypothetical protein